MPLAMSSRMRPASLSRRAFMLGVAASAATGSASEASPGALFTHGGPDALRYGEADNFPVPPRERAIAQGNPWLPGDRVGAFSHLDDIYPTRRVSHASLPWTFMRTAAPPALNDALSGHLSRHPVTGLLVSKDDRILFEHYQYGRTDTDRLLGQSMTKSITGLLVGLAVADGVLASVDDTADKYVPGLKGSEYGRTPLRALLQMSSGVDFGEERDDGRDLSTLWRDMVLGRGLFGKKGTVASIRQFDRRVALPGTAFRYASIEPDVLAIVLRAALGQPLSSYLRDKLWVPLGTETDATWMTDAEGNELGHFGFSAALRDYARLGRLLACDGAWNGRQLVPASWLHDATTVRSSQPYLAPGRSMKLGYGYLLWLLPGERRQFALVGQNGQRICVDPQASVVMVHTALEDVSQAWGLWSRVCTTLA